MSFLPHALTANYAVSPQLTAADMAQAYQLGFRSIINHRPDGEETGQPATADLAKAASEAGLQYVHIPVEGPVSPAQVQAMRQALAILPSPVLAFCRSGGRSTRLYDLARDHQ